MNYYQKILDILAILNKKKAYALATLISLLCLKVLKDMTQIAKPTIKKKNGKWTIINWGLCQTWSPKEIFAPKDFKELMDFMQTYKQKGIKNIRAFGALHSWSRCADTTGVNIDTRGLTKVLEVDKKKLRIKVEAGIQLKALYNILRENGMALPMMPNVDVITLGGAVSNGTHGTNIKNGSFSSLVYGIELIDASGKMWNLTRDSKDPTIYRYFDAALISFGSLGIFYSITLQCVEDYNMIQIMSQASTQEVKSQVIELTKKYDSVFYGFSSTDICALKICIKVPVIGTSSIAVKKIENVLQPLQKFFFFGYFLCNYLGKFAKLSQKALLKSWKSINCVNWDLYEILPHSKPFINMEYGIPEAKINEAIEFLTQTFKENKVYNREGAWVLRPVGADDRGYLSATRRDDGTPTYYIDMPYQNMASESEAEVYKKIEEGFLKLGGRCSFSRLFWNHSSKILENFWDKGGVEWKKVKLELDPDHVFTNQLVNSIFFENKIKLN